MERPPCFETLGVTDCLRRQHDWLVYGNGPLFGAWAGWRIAGAELVGPERQRIHINRVSAVMRMDEAARRPRQCATVMPFKARQSRWTTP